MRPETTTTQASDPEPQALIPPCPHFGPCGGCQLQHLTYPTQLTLKANRLHTLLGATNLTLPELQLHPSPPLAYRNRIRLTLAEVLGQIRAGYLTRSADYKTGCPTPGVSEGGVDVTQPPMFLPITQCPIAAPILWSAAESLLTLFHQSPTPWLRNPTFRLDQLELFATADESALQLTLYLRTAATALPTKLAAAFTTLCESLCTHIPQLTGAGIAMLPSASSQRSRRNEVPKPGPTWGDPGLTYTVSFGNDASAHPELTTEDEVVILSAAKDPRISPLQLPVPQPVTDNLQPATSYWLPRTAFFQVNRFLLPELLALVAGDASSGCPTQNRTGALAWDLYAGVGLFSRALAPHFVRITAVEIAEPAFSALAAGSEAASGSKAGKFANLRAVKSTTLDFLRAAVVDRDRPALIVLDPPRSGAGPEVCTLLAQIAAPTLIYVSCSPEQLAADLQTLAASGYVIADLHLLDLFPQTTHIETLAILTR
jgi:23S rRNA (uracil1939-C5)-methyltransferase